MRSVADCVIGKTHADPVKRNPWLVCTALASKVRNMAPQDRRRLLKRLDAPPSTETPEAPQPNATTLVIERLAPDMDRHAFRLDTVQLSICGQNVGEDEGVAL